MRWWMTLAGVGIIGGCKVKVRCGGSPDIPLADNADLVAQLRTHAGEIGDVTGVTCPPLLVKQGAKVDCQVTFSEGPQRIDHVVVKDDDGSLTFRFDDALVDRAAVIASITKALAAAGLSATTVTCPGNLELTPGKHWTCTVTLASGQVVHEEVRINADGLLDHAVREQEVDTDKLEAKIMEQSRAAHADLDTVDCGSGRIVASELTCVATGRGGQRSLTVTVDDTGKGHVDLEPNAGSGSATR